MSARELSDGELDLLDERRQEALDALLDLREDEDDEGAGPWVWPPVEGNAHAAVYEALLTFVGTFEDEDGYTCPVVLDVLPVEARS